ncbi:DUF2334 domain-containing protein [Intestinibacillus massiliensis]|nr:DUF2334 domain-containing protein [Intestinibacillus massiliensis]
MKRTKIQRRIVGACALAVCATALASALYNVTTTAAPEQDAVVEVVKGGQVPAGAVRADAEFVYQDSRLAMAEAPYFVGGRLYVARDAFARAAGREGVAAWRESRPACGINGRTYGSLYDVCETLGLWPVFDTDARAVTLYHAPPETAPAAQGAAQAAYLRLEDIVADYGISGRFDDEGLEKLRAQADYLYRHGQQYYIAWIPVYANPQEGIVNDLTRNYSFYNAQFLYTLDFMAGHGGELVAHGLTHQQGDEISAEGTEFGDETPFSEKEVRRRMGRILEIADTLGYTVRAFEFPHYASTPAQERIAAEYFEVICQQDKNTRTLGGIEQEHAGAREVTYLPTPQDYVKSAERKGEMLQAVKAAPRGGLVSLFFHPSLDRDSLAFAVDGDGVRTYAYAESGFLPQLLTVLRGKNLELAVLA